MGDCNNWNAWYDQRPPHPPRLIVTGECRLAEEGEIELTLFPQSGSAGDGMSIRGPLMASRSRPPVFQVRSGSNTFFSVEVTTDARLFNLADHGQERTDANFYASWTQGLQRADGETTFTLPEDVWGRLGTAERLAYRLVTSSQPDRWDNCGTTITDEDALQAPILLPGDTDVSLPDGTDTLVLMRHVRLLAATSGGVGNPTIARARFTAQIGMEFNHILILPDQISLEIDRTVL